MGPAQVGPLAGAMGLHPSQTDVAITLLSQRACVGDPLAQRIMADHWQRQAAMSEGSGYRYLDRSPATYEQPSPPQRDFSRVVVAGISLDTVEQAQNSLYVFHNLCARTGTPLSGGTPQQDKALGQLVDLWCEKNIRIVTALRSNFPRGGSGVDKLRLVEQLFINPKVLQRDQKPEAAVAAFDFGQMLGGSGLDFHDKAQQLRELTSRLPAAVRGDDEYWIRRIREEAGMEIMFYYAEVLPNMAECDGDVTQASAASDWLIFLRVMAAAIDRSRRAAKPSPAQYWHVPAHSGGNGLAPPAQSEGSQDSPSHSGGQRDAQGATTAGQPAANLHNASASGEPPANQAAAGEEGWLADFRELAEQLGLEPPTLRFHSLPPAGAALAEDSMREAGEALLRGWPELQLHGHQPPPATAAELSAPAGQVSSGDPRQAPCQVAAQFPVAVDQEHRLPAVSSECCNRLSDFPV